uniref:Uncharacterized protein n=1 Tax=Magallana gigas TaxID=29159 RepID=K1Q4E3_MAGGI
MDELGRETESSRSLSSDYLQNAIEFLPLQYTRMSTTTDTLGTGRVQNYVEETVPTFESLRSSCGLDVNSSPLSTRNPVPAPSLTSQRPSSKSSSRSKIRDALQFASQNLDDAA